MKLCTIEGCNTKHFCKGYCKRHHTRWLRHGDATTCYRGLDNMDITYASAHARVRTVRGKATQHQCQHCNEQAQEWAYNHAGEIELIGDNASRGKVIQCAYSPNPDDYLPLCKSCHTTYDAHRGAKTACPGTLVRRNLPYLVQPYKD